MEEEIEEKEESVCCKKRFEEIDNSTGPSTFLMESENFAKEKSTYEKEKNVFGRILALLDRLLSKKQIFTKEEIKILENEKSIEFLQLCAQTSNHSLLFVSECNRIRIVRLLDNLDSLVKEYLKKFPREDLFMIGIRFKECRLEIMKKFPKVGEQFALLEEAFY